MKKVLLFMGIVLTIVLFERLLSATSLFNQLEMNTYDMRAKLATDYGTFGNNFTHATDDIVLVAVDDVSRKEISNHPELNIGSWPWKRDTWANVVNYIEKGKPKAILFDIIFNGLNDNPWADRTLAQEFRRYNNIVLATSLNDPKFLVDKLAKGAKIANGQFFPTVEPLNVRIYDKNIDDAITYYSHAPVHDIYTKYNTVGVVNKVTESDSVIRKAQPIFKLIKGDEVYYMPSLAFAGFLKYMGEGDEIVVKEGKLFYKDREIPVDENGYTNIGWHGFGKDYDYIPISKVFLHDTEDSELEPSFFKDKIVVIGRTEAGSDIHPSSVNPSYAGPEANATAIDNFINDGNSANLKSRKFLTKLHVFEEYVLILFVCALIALVGIISKNAFIGFINSFLVIVLFVLVAIWAYAAPGVRLWIPMVVPIYYLLVTAGIVFAVRFQKETSKKAAIMNMFGKFVSPKVLSGLLKSGNLSLRNTRKRITVMFCDVKNFTTLSEKCNPEELVDGLNELFNEIVNIIFANNGTVDKFVGDCVMAYWGDPVTSDDDEYMAVKTAIEIKKKVNELRIKNARENKLVLDVKIGLNTGEALLGLAGSEKIMSYTCMGDAVNVAARLEASCSKLGRDVLISKATYEGAKDKVAVLEVGKISVKGKDEQIEVYEPIGLLAEGNANAEEEEDTLVDENN